jgi:hypothetical protein
MQNNQELNFMSHNFINNIDTNTEFRSPEVVSIPVSLSESIHGNYFVGQTDPLFVCDQEMSFGGLVNPCDSGVILFTNVFTISNFSDDYITAEIWINTDFPKNADISHRISPTNTALCPAPQNKVDIKFVNSATVPFRDGVNVYDRIVPPNTTLVGEEDGKFITSPGGNYTVVIKSESSILDKIIIAFGWWEQKI